MAKIMSLMNFQDSFQVSQQNQLFTDELTWLFTKTAAPAEALFIPYAYTGSLFPDYLKQMNDIFTPLNIKLIDINSSNPATLIMNAKMIIIGGGDINALVTKLNSLRTSSFDAFAAIKSRIDSGIPFLGWNEGAAIMSPKYFNPPSTTLLTGIGATSFQIICNYNNVQMNRDAIRNYLVGNLAVKKAICQVARLKDDKSSVRLEDSGGGMIDTATEPFPTVIRYELLNGNLIES